MIKKRKLKKRKRKARSSIKTKGWNVKVDTSSIKKEKDGLKKIFDNLTKLCSCIPKSDGAHLRSWNMLAKQIYRALQVKNQVFFITMNHEIETHKSVVEAAYPCCHIYNPAEARFGFDMGE